MHYTLSEADLKPLPADYGREPRYLGYREEDLARPYASFFRPDVAPVQQHVLEPLAGQMAAPEDLPRLSDAARALEAPGTLPVETGYGVNADGHLVIAVQTQMPGVTGEMWDWWFGWHGMETQRYKLWHPRAHVFSRMAEDRRGIEGLTDRQRYVGNASFVDEYIGGALNRLVIRFFDPALLGFAPSRPGETVITARAGPTEAPVAAGWLLHQLRATPDGCEMRSRFFLNAVAPLAVPPGSLMPGPGRLLARPGLRDAVAAIAGRVGGVAPRRMGPDLMHHCAQEMNHLAGFLPALHAAFGGTR